MILVAETTVKLVAATAPKTTLVAPVKLVPVMVTVVPPLVGPDLGETAVTVGAATAPKSTLVAPVIVTVVPPALVAGAEEAEVTIAGDAVEVAVEVNTLPSASTAAQMPPPGHDTEKSWLLPSMSAGSDHEDPLEVRAVPFSPTAAQKLALGHDTE